jgi:hypothetical protein
MEKTANVIIEETKIKIAQAIQDSGLPVSVLDMILKDLYTEIHALAVDVIRKEMQEYKNTMSV